MVYCYISGGRQSLRGSRIYDCIRKVATDVIYTRLAYDINLVSVSLRIFLAFIFSGIIGLERGANRHPAGFRTYILVCIGATLAMMTNQFMLQTFGSRRSGTSRRAGHHRSRLSRRRHHNHNRKEQNKRPHHSSGTLVWQPVSGLPWG